MEKNKAFDALMREYKNKKIEKERAADEALDLLVTNRPEFAALEKALRAAEIAAAKAKAAGGGGKEAAALDKARAARNKWLKENALSPEAFLPRYDCAACGDTGISGGRYCACFVKKLNERLAAGGAAESGNTFATARHTDIADLPQRERLQKTYAAMKEFCGKFPAVGKKNVALIGKTGTGKTYLLSAMVNELAARDVGVVYMTAFALNNLLLKCHTSFDEDTAPYLALLADCDVLAIDDLGTEPIYKNVTKEYLYSIINERNAKNKCTLFSTNLHPIEISDRYDNRTAYRLLDKDKTMVIEFTGNDLRMKKGE